jgi:hypothetical protein
MDTIVFGNVTVYDVITQCAGAAGMLAIFYSFQKDVKRQIIGICLIGMLFFCVHFLLLGKYTGAVMNIFGAVRNGIILLRPRKWAESRIWLYIFCGIYIAVGIFTWESPMSLSPAVGTVFGTFAVFAEKTKNIRRLALVCSVGWLAYNIYSFSVPGMITEVAVHASILIAMFRYDFKKTAEPAP